MQNKVRWLVFLGGLTAFVIGVELWHRHVQEKDLAYQCRILIDKDFSVEESSPEEEIKSEKISLYTQTKYGVLPRKQSDPMKIFKAYSADVEDENINKYVKVAVIVQNATRSNIQNIIEKLPNEKVSFIIPYYALELNKIAEIIVSAGHEFFVQIPTQSSIPLDKKDEVSPFLANASSEEVIDKLSYLIASVKYAIGVANTSDALITKSRKDMQIIAQELSQRGMAFLNIEEDNEVLDEISSRIKLLSLRAKLLDEEGILNTALAAVQAKVAKLLNEEGILNTSQASNQSNGQEEVKGKEQKKENDSKDNPENNKQVVQTEVKNADKKDNGSFIINSDQLDQLKKVLPKDITMVPMSFGVKNASL